MDSCSRAESTRYLRDRTGLDDDAGADAVADQLGDHPLALAQAAATIRRLRRTYPAYLNRLTHTPITQLLQRLPGHDYPLSTAPALLLGTRPGGRGPHRAHQPDPARTGRDVRRRCPA